MVAAETEALLRIDHIIIGARDIKACSTRPIRPFEAFSHCVKSLPNERRWSTTVNGPLFVPRGRVAAQVVAMLPS